MAGSAVICTQALCQLAGAMTVESSAYLVDDVTVMQVRGRIESRDLEAWANALEVAGLLARGPIVIDLDGLENGRSARRACC